MIGGGIVGNSIVGHLAELGWTDPVQLDTGPFPHPGAAPGHAADLIFPLDHAKRSTQTTLAPMRTGTDATTERAAGRGGGGCGSEENRRRLPGLLAAMPGRRYDSGDVVAEGPRVFAAYTLRTTVNERPIAVRGVMHFLVRDGHIAHRTDYWDSLVFQRQAGMA